MQSERKKHADRIDPKLPALYRGEIRNFLVSPDKRKIAITGGNRMVIVSWDETPEQQVTPVNSIDFGDRLKKPKPFGNTFFRDQDFQWSKDLTTLYLIQDKYYDSKSSQLFSKEGELWKYDLKTGNLTMILKPFPAYNYFFDAENTITFLFQLQMVI